MLEELNDNLQQADGQEETTSIENQTPISEETELLKQQIAEEIKNLGDPIDAKMNHNDKLGDSKNQNLVMKNKSTSENKPDKAPKTDGDHPVDGDFPMEVDMNQQPSKQGSDEKASTAVEVKAGSAIGRGAIATTPSGLTVVAIAFSTSGLTNSVLTPCSAIIRHNG